MKNIYGNQVTEKKAFYVPHMSSFYDIKKVLDHLPSFNNIFKENLDFQITYYDTSNGFLKNMGVIVSLTKYLDKNIVTFEYNTELVTENPKNTMFELEIDKKETILSPSALRFIEDRLSVIFGTKLQIDIMHALKKLSPKYRVIINRKIYEIDHNTGFESKAYMDDVNYINVETNNKYSDRIFEIFVTSAATDFNIELFNRVLKYIKDKVVLVEMTNTRLDDIKLYTSLSKKPKRK